MHKERRLGSRDGWHLIHGSFRISRVAASLERAIVGNPSQPLLAVSENLGGLLPSEAV